MVIIEINNSQEINKLSINKPLVATIGQFDGLHEAHRVLIKTTIKKAQSLNMKSAIITFQPHPDFVLKKHQVDDYLTPEDIKSHLINDFSIDYLIIIHFDEILAKLSHPEFINQYLIKLGVRELIIGFDFHYGFMGQGNCTTIKSDSNNTINITVISELKYQQKKIGSNLIRQLLEKGKVNEVNKLLNRNYEIIGKVINGNHIGSTLNVPTANLVFREDFVIPKEGVYVCYVNFINNKNKQKYLSICNIGHNPSFNYQKELRVEVHLLDFEGNLYDQELVVSFIDYLRDEIVFNNTIEFIKQIELDKAQARLLVEKYN